MRVSRSYNALMRWAALGAALLLASGTVLAAGPQALLQQTNEYPHARTINLAEAEVLDHEVGLGAIRKLGGAWQFKESERFSGHLTRYTWQVVDGFTSIEVMNELVTAIEEMANSELLFACEGRSCGPGVQWANRVFHQPLLYGRENLQRYRVYRVQGDVQYLLTIYSGARTADRQYLHAELLKVAQ